MYQLNTGSGSEDFNHDVLRYDVAYSHRMLPREIPRRNPWALYGVVELNGNYSTNGRNVVFAAPGLQLITPQLILEAGPQVPVVEELGRNEVGRDCSLILSVRAQF